MTLAHTTLRVAFWLLVIGLASGFPSLVAAVHLEYVPIPQHVNVVFQSTPLLKKTLDRCTAQDIYPMRHANGSLYVCIVLTQSETDHVTFEPRLLSERLRDGEALPTAAAWAIYDKMSSHPCLLSFTNGWWRYELCWGSHVLQYHQSASEPHFIDSRAMPRRTYIRDREYIVLGNITREGRGSSRAARRLLFGTDTNGRFAGITYSGGDWCDIRQRPRRVHIRLYCNRESQRLNPYTSFVVTEEDTCDYVLRMFTQHACVEELSTIGMYQTLLCYPIADA